MCYDDFDFDGFDGIDDPDDDFQEDMFDEFETAPDELEMELEADEPIATEPDDPESAFDFREAFILGGMILGQAYEEALDETEHKNNEKDDVGD